MAMCVPPELDPRIGEGVIICAAVTNSNLNPVFITFIPSREKKLKFDQQKQLELHIQLYSVKRHNLLKFDRQTCMKRDLIDKKTFQIVQQLSMIKSWIWLMAKNFSDLWNLNPPTIDAGGVIYRTSVSDIYDTGDDWFKPNQ